ncbi:outer membrane protein [Helicobacter cetorum]|uniref:Outer membrane protein n=1 Tax=Helicobacter cetorum (strain ATCC BAA-540 / CCUG 52418 / MIT 99-5656) TaxID=1163745 RepID=I0EQ43_HELCM|nr:outer membrane protein [Helicobacter cetorum MIT 99-5656]
MIKIKKTSMALALSLFLSGLHAEDNGYFVSVGYQIGQASQMVKNTGELQKLSDTYANLNNLLANYNSLNWAVTNAGSATSINSAIDNLSASANNLTNGTTQSPAYQAVLLALNSAVAMWQIIASRIGCGNDLNQSNQSNQTNQTNQTINNVPNESGSVTCNRTTSGWGGVISHNTFKKINDAFVVIHNALKDNGMLALKDSNNASQEMKKVQQAVLQAVVAIKEERGVNVAEAAQESKAQETHAKSEPAKAEQKNTATYLLSEAQTLIDTLTTGDNNKETTGCPWFEVPNNDSTKTYYGINSASGSVCDLFKDPFDRVKQMLATAKEVVQKTQNVSATQEQKIQTPSSFNPYTNNHQVAQTMLKTAQTQANILNLVNQVGNDFKAINARQRELMTRCMQGANTIAQGSNVSGCAKLQATLNSLEQESAYYGNQVNQALTIADTLLHFKERVATLKDTYGEIKNNISVASSLPNSKLALQNLVSTTTDSNKPVGLQTVYYLNQNAYSQMQTAMQELANNPFRNFGVIKSQSNSGVMNGIGIQLGYKQFFGENRNYGVKYYGFFDYNHTYIKSDFFNSASNVFTYGAGADALYNFINDKATNLFGKNNKLSVGVFGGIALAGTSWANSNRVNLETVNNIYNAKISAANFQFLFNFGLRANLAEEKKGNHAIQHGMELGIKIPTINTSYYSFMGAKLSYRRLYSIYLNYVFAY